MAGIPVPRDLPRGEFSHPDTPGSARSARPLEFTESALNLLPSLAVYICCVACPSHSSLHRERHKRSVPGLPLKYLERNGRMMVFVIDWDDVPF